MLQALCRTLLLISLATLAATADESRGFKAKLTPIKVKLAVSRAALKVDTDGKLKELSEQAKLDLKLSRKLLVFSVLPNRQVSLKALTKSLAGLHKSVRVLDAQVVGKVTFVLAQEHRWLKTVQLWRSLKGVKAITVVRKPKKRGAARFEMVVASPGITIGFLRRAAIQALDLKKVQLDPVGDLIWHGPKVAGAEGEKKKQRKGSGGRKKAAEEGDG